MSKPSFKKAFTVVELMVVMAIIALLSGLGIQALITFQQTVQFQQAQADIITIFNNIRNQARNSVASKGEVIDGSTLPNAVVDGYAIFFDDNTYSLRSCTITRRATSELEGSCNKVEDQDAKPISVNEVNIYPLDPSVCKGILIERLSVDFYAMEDITSTLQNPAECVFRIEHSRNSELVRDIKIDLINNTSEIF